MQNSEQATQKNQTPSFKCERCGGSGMYFFEQKASEYAKENGKPHIYGDNDPMIWVSKKCPFCNGGFSENVKVAKKLAGIPETFYNKRLDAFDWSVYVDDRGNMADTTAQQDGIKSFIDKFDVWESKNIGLYIYSKTKGAGKTFLASCICNELMHLKAIRTRFVNASSLIDVSQTEDSKLLYECKFLVIDDLGQKHLGNDWLEDILYKILDERMTNKRMTVITSNVEIKALPFNERITDRIDKLCMPFHLPETCVRSKETREERQELLKELGLKR